MVDHNLISRNLERVRERIHHAAQSSGRSAEQVRLIVVTKGHPQNKVQQVVETGVKDIGENYVEESLLKMVSVGPDVELTWHMIGHVQSRKAKLVSQNFDWVQTVDSIKLAGRLNRFAGQFERKIPVLLECNVSGEESKYGWISWNELEWLDFAEEISPILEMENLLVQGLMTMAPYYKDPLQAKPIFQRLRKLKDFLAKQFPAQEWAELSMGMSGDFEVAIQEGATMVRIGTAILGERETKEGK
jgi:pyridoxal phosphate enzyme (YggS family)